MSNNYDWFGYDNWRLREPPEPENENSYQDYLDYISDLENSDYIEE